MRPFAPRATDAISWRAWTLWLLALGLATGLMVITRGRLEKVHVAMVYLVLVQLASARGGRTLGVVLSGVAFLLFNWFFLPPYGTLVIARPLDWVVLAAFLVTSLLSAQLLYLARAEARLARERAEEAERSRTLQEAQRAKDAVIAAVSHDLRTPLTTIKGLAHEIAADGDDRAEIIEEESDRLTEFVADLLDLSRVTSGAAIADVQPNEAEDLLGAAAQQVRGRLAGRELRIQTGGEALLFGRFDFSQTLRALVNLIENAAKYSPEDTPIEVTVRPAGGRLEFVVADRGPGVPAEDTERIFEPFFRGRVQRSGGTGTGLGLSISRGIAEAQGGTLTYAPREGGGSLFTLSLPRIDDLSAPQARTAL